MDQWAYMRGAEFQGRLMLIAGYLARKIDHDTTVLDLDCGDAMILDYLPDCRYVGNDINPRVVNRARERYAERRSTVFLMGSDEYVASEYMAGVDVLMALGYACGRNDEESTTLEGSIKRLVTDKEPSIVILEGWEDCLNYAFGCLVDWIKGQGYVTPHPWWQVEPVGQSDRRATRQVVILERDNA